MVARLVVYARPLPRTTKSWDALVERLKSDADLADTEFRVWPAKPGDAPGYFTRERLRTYARDLAAQIDQWHEVACERNEGRSYDEIVLVGNSLGTLSVRWAWLFGSGALPEEGQVSRPWAKKINRIVLIAGLNRGFDTRNNPNTRRFLVKVLVTVVAALRDFTWKDALAGSAFVTNLRLRWMQHMSRLRDTNPDAIPTVVQVLGARDPYVGPEDSRDVEQFPKAAQILVPGARHSDVLSLDVDDAPDRYTTLRRALFGTVSPTEPGPVDDPEATDLAFVVHGIRAGAYGWVQQLRRRLADAPDWRVLSPTYRYFSALAFAWPWTRRRKVRWFLDQYTREYAQHPRAQFHFAGHSNGTYVLGEALAQVPAVSFQRIYLASSVLPEEYPWSNRLGSGQAQRVRADRGSTDIPVAILSRGLSFMGDIGGGGFEGFTELQQPSTTQWGWTPGGHAAPLNTDERVANVAQYVVTGSAPRPPDLLTTPPTLLSLASRSARYWVPLVLIALVALLSWQALLGAWVPVAAVALILVVLLFV